MKNPAPLAMAALLAVCLSAQTRAQDASSAAPPPPPDAKVAVVNPEDLLDTDRTLLVPTALVSLAVEGRAAATRQSGFFQRGNASAQAAVGYRVAGIDKAFAQALARAALEDFVAQLRAAGYTVKTYDDVKDRDHVRQAEREKADPALGLPTFSEGGTTFVRAAPSDEQQFASQLAGGVFADFIKHGKSLVTDATVVIPQYRFHAPQAWAAGERGYNSVSATANIAPGMNLSLASAHWLGQPKSRMMRGIPGVALQAPWVNVAEKVGELAQTADTTPQAANALSSVLSRLGGGGDTQRSSSEYAMTVDRDAYRQGALGAIRAFNGIVAKTAAEARP